MNTTNENKPSTRFTCNICKQDFDSSEQGGWVQDATSNESYPLCKECWKQANRKAPHLFWKEGIKARWLSLCDDRRWSLKFLCVAAIYLGLAVYSYVMHEGLAFSILAIVAGLTFVVSFCSHVQALKIEHERKERGE